ncbi:Kelch repeat-containing protein [Desulfatibacillum aliphaticivorans]|uniref:Kelch repeat-containing protein n=1 Tax=Desulfatibacillum aliphaticivorans TaxID=218208 RepID=UPI00041198A8|nr:kelch repeat-containing protein [Desulfatibacillum aliphaticivorans]
MSPKRNEEYAMEIAFNGAWRPSADPLSVGAGNFSVLQNTRYAQDGSLEGVSGYSPINPKPLVDPDYDYVTALAICGTSAQSDCDEYDPVLESWAARTDVPSPGRYGNMGAGVENLAFTIGGMDGSGLITEALDAVTDVWESRCDMPEPLRSYGAAFAYDGSIYVAGGYDYTSGNLQDCNRYDPLTDSWSSMTDMPSPARRYIAACLLGYKGYVFGGYDSSDPLDDCDVYNPLTDVWSSGASMNLARCGVYAFGLDDAAYLAGGGEGILFGANYRDCHSYDPETDSYAVKEDIPSPARISGGAQTVAGQGLIYAGGAILGLRDVETYDADADAWASQDDMPSPGRVYLGSASVQYS